MKGPRSSISIFLPSLRGGGVERLQLHLARGFIERGYTLDLVLANAEGPYLSNMYKFVKLVNFKTSRVLFSLPSLVSYLRKERPAVLLTAMSHTNVVALLAHRIARVPTRMVISEHSNLSSSVQNANTIRGRFVPVLMRLIYPWADAIVAVSEGVADDLARVIKLPRERITTIYNPVISPELFKKAQMPIDHPWFQPGKPPVILGAGRLTKPKEFSTLIRAFALVYKKRHSRLVILGDGEKRHELEELSKKLGIASNIDMPGFVDNPFAYMTRSAVFVLSSAWEGFGNVLVEAMACGCQVVSTNCPSGPAEILKNGKYGILIPVGDIEGLADAILRTFNSSACKKMLIRRATEFSVERGVNRYLSVMEHG